MNFNGFNIFLQISIIYHFIQVTGHLSLVTNLYTADFIKFLLISINNLLIEPARGNETMNLIPNIPLHK